MMKLRRWSGHWLLLVCIGLSGCATSGGPDSTPAHDNMDAVLWQQSSTEYAALAAGVYSTATAALQNIANSADGGADRMAVVLDIDETVLDNSRYQAQLVNDGETYGSESWDRWIALRAASAVPGVVDFLRVSESLGVHVAFVTNRACRARPGSDDVCPQKEDTFANLRDVGINIESTTLFLRGEIPPEACKAELTVAEQADGKWSSDKTSRRGCIRLDYDIVMLFGDQLGDFTEVEEGTKTGRELAAEFDEYWGTAWFMLPNPTYGGWRPGSFAEKQERLRGID